MSIGTNLRAKEWTLSSGGLSYLLARAGKACAKNSPLVDCKANDKAAPEIVQGLQAMGALNSANELSSDAAEILAALCQPGDQVNLIGGPVGRHLLITTYASGPLSADRLVWYLRDAQGNHRLSFWLHRAFLIEMLDGWLGFQIPAPSQSFQETYTAGALQTVAAMADARRESALSQLINRDNSLNNRSVSMESILQAFPREKAERFDTRWLAILLDQSMTTRFPRKKKEQQACAKASLEALVKDGRVQKDGAGIIPVEETESIMNLLSEPLTFASVSALHPVGDGKIHVRRSTYLRCAGSLWCLVPDDPMRDDANITVTSILSSELKPLLLANLQTTVEANSGSSSVPSLEAGKPSMVKGLIAIHVLYVLVLGGLAIAAFQGGADAWKAMFGFWSIFSIPVLFCLLGRKSPARILGILFSLLTFPLLPLAVPALYLWNHKEVKDWLTQG